MAIDTLPCGVELWTSWFLYKVKIDYGVGPATSNFQAEDFLCVQVMIESDAWWNAKFSLLLEKSRV